MASLDPSFSQPSKTIDNGASNSSSRSARGAALDLSQLFNLYVQQALHGCGDSRCTESACHTGRVNASRHPVRRYNERSARAIALTMCAGPKPRLHLCPYFDASRSSGSSLPPGDGDARDPSNLMQLLCDTKSINEVSSGVGELHEDQDSIRIHQNISEMLTVAGRIPSLSASGFLNNQQLADGIFECFQWLLNKAPLNRAAPWKMINREFVSKGYAYPPRHENLPVDETYNTWLAILDVLDHEPNLRLVQRMMKIVSARRELESFLHAAAANSGSETKFKRPQESVEYLLARKLSSEGTSTPIFPLATVVWLKKFISKYWDSQPIIRESSPSFAALQILAHLHDKHSPDVQDEAFKMPLIISRTGMLELSSSFLSEDRGRALHILAFNYLFSFAELSLVFRMVNHLKMREAHSAVDKALALRRRSGLHVIEDEYLPEQIQHAEQHYLLLNVGRGSVLMDAFDQLWQRRKGELRRPLRVRLGEADELEIGHDLGGVQIEFFNLICKEAFAEEAQMFTTDSTTGLSYFRPGSLQPLHMYELLGLLVSLALFNGITLPINLPWAFYAHMRGTINPPEFPDLGPPAIKDGWPVVANSLYSILHEHVEDLDFTFPLEANGLRLTVLLPSSEQISKGQRRELKVVSSVSSNGKPIDVENISESWPGWKLVKPTEQDDITDVTPENQRAYVHDYAQFLCYGSVAPQCDAFFRGFHSTELLRPCDLDLFTALDLKLHLEGSDHLDIQDLKNCAKYEGHDPKSRYIASFWKIVMSWPEAKHKQLLKFVTAAERIPISGAKHLPFVIKKTTPENGEMLPTSSTCFGTLYLPKYPSPEVLAAKLNLALRYGCEGFGNG